MGLINHQKLDDVNVANFNKDIYGPVVAMRVTEDLVFLYNKLINEAVGLPFSVFGEIIKVFGRYNFFTDTKEGSNSKLMHIGNFLHLSGKMMMMFPGSSFPAIN